jgi:hypothetical protein
MCKECQHNWKLHKQAEDVLPPDLAKFKKSHRLKKCNGNNCSFWRV